MSQELLSEFIYHLDVDGSMKLGYAPKNVQAWLEKVVLPMDVLRFLQWDWPQIDSQIGNIAVKSSKNIMKHKRTAALLQHSFLQLGAAPNGDFFVLDISTEQCRPGFISHEEYWEYEKSPQVIFQPIARSLESLLYRIVEGRYIPTDYYAAKAFNAFLEEERRNLEPCAAPNGGPAAKLDNSAVTEAEYHDKKKQFKKTALKN